MAFAVVQRMRARVGTPQALGVDGNPDAVPTTPPSHAVCASGYPVYYSDGSCRDPVLTGVGVETPSCDDPSTHWDAHSTACIPGSQADEITRSNLREAAAALGLGLGAGAFAGAIVASVYAGIAGKEGHPVKGAAIGAALLGTPAAIWAYDLARGIH